MLIDALEEVWFKVPWKLMPMLKSKDLILSLIDIESWSLS